MSLEMARYRGGAQSVVSALAAVLARCRAYQRVIGGTRSTVDVDLIASPAGAAGAGAHIATTVETEVGRQVLEYLFLVVRQGDGSDPAPRKHPMNKFAPGLNGELARATSSASEGSS